MALTAVQDHEGYRLLELTEAGSDDSEYRIESPGGGLYAVEQTEDEEGNPTGTFYVAHPAYAQGATLEELLEAFASVQESGVEEEVLEQLREELRAEEPPTAADQLRKEEEQETGARAAMAEAVGFPEAPKPFATRAARLRAEGDQEAAASEEAPNTGETRKEGGGAEAGGADRPETPEGNTGGANTQSAGQRAGQQRTARQRIAQGDQERPAGEAGEGDGDVPGERPGEEEDAGHGDQGDNVTT